jgi:Ca-activated chloride channel homolog
MSFIWPVMLRLLVVIPLFVALYLRMQGQRRRAAAQYAGLNLVQAGTGRGPGLRRHIPPALFLLALSVLFVALARPQTVVSLPRVEGIVVLAFDVSGSMAADDLKPTRMEAAKAAAQDFVEHQPPSVQIGVVAFSDSGFTVQPPTNDRDAILASINRLSPQRGTAVANGILISLDAIARSLAQNIQGDTNGEPSHLTDLTPAPTPVPTPLPKGTYTSAVIVLLTDGENNERPDPLAAAQVASDRGVRIYTVGIGSPAGATLHINGFTVHTQLDEDMLQQISQLTGGSYYSADSEQELRTIYDNLDPQLVIKPEKIEVTSIFAGMSVLLMLTGGLVSLAWFNHVP